TAVIMGANIGTTVTAQIAALQGFDFIAYAVILTVVGIFINMLAKRDRVKTIGMILAGLGIVFVSLNYMSISMKIFSGADSPIQAFFQQISNPFLLLAVGIIFTILMQSSSALTVVLIAMVNAGIVIGGGGNSALYIVLGSNIGTCFTALLSTVGTSANAKRAGVIHLLFNVFGSLLFMIVLLCWKDFNDVLFVNTFPGRPGTQIAMFHTAFNTICTLLFVPFSSLLVKIATWLVKDKKAIAKKEVMFIDDRVLKTPTLAIELAIKEIRYLAEIAQSSMNKALEGFYTVDTNVAEDVTDQMAKIARINDEIIQYMVKISTHDISFHDEQTMSGLHHVLGDVVRIGDLSQNITK
ncbi:MAG: Na/Pi symporter, partial [Clostridia bacterium]